MGRWMMLAALLMLSAVAHAQSGTGAVVPVTVSFATEDGGLVYADVYGSSQRAVILAHGGRFNKESWAKQATVLVKAGFQVVAIDFRGVGKSHGPGDKDVLDAPLWQDVLAAVRYLHAHGAKSVSVVGGSMGGAAAADAAIMAKPGEVDRLVMLGASPNMPAEKLRVPALYIVARDDANSDGLRLPAIQKQFDKTPEPKKLVLLDGSAHAQYLFETDHAERVTQEMLAWLEAK